MLNGVWEIEDRRRPRTKDPHVPSFAVGWGSSEPGGGAVSVGRGECMTPVALLLAPTSSSDLLCGHRL